jgi:hypothetical protein
VKFVQLDARAAQAGMTIARMRNKCELVHAGKTFYGILIS